MSDVFWQCPEEYSSLEFLKFFRGNVEIRIEKYSDRYYNVFAAVYIYSKATCDAWF